MPPRTSMKAMKSSKKEAATAENDTTTNEQLVKGLMSGRSMVALGGGISGAKRSSLKAASEAGEAAVGGFAEALFGEGANAAPMTAEEQKKQEDLEVRQRFYAHFAKAERTKLKSMPIAYHACETAIRSSIQTVRAGGKFPHGMYANLRLAHLYPMLAEDLGNPLPPDHAFYKSLKLDPTGSKLVNDLTARNTYISDEEGKLLLRCALGLGGIATNKAAAFLELLATTVLIVEQGNDNAVKAAFSGFLEGGPLHALLAQYYDDTLFLDLVKQKMSDPKLAKTWVRGPCAGMRMKWILLPHQVSLDQFIEVLDAEGADALAQFQQRIDTICDNTAFGDYLLSKYRAHAKMSTVEAEFCVFLRTKILNANCTSISDLDVRRLYTEATDLFLATGSLSSIVTADFLDDPEPVSVHFAVDDPKTKMEIMASGAIAMRFASQFNPIFYETKVGGLLHKIESAPLKGGQPTGQEGGLGSNSLGSLGVGIGSSSSATGTAVSASSSLGSNGAPNLLVLAWGCESVHEIGFGMMDHMTIAPMMLMEQLQVERMKLHAAAKANEATLWSPLFVLLTSHCRKQKSYNALFQLHLINNSCVKALNDARMYLLDCVIAGGESTAEELCKHLESIDFHDGLQFLDFGADYNRYVTTIGKLIGAMVPTVSGIDARVRDHMSISTDTNVKADQFVLALVEAIRSRHNFDSQEKLEEELAELVSQARKPDSRTADFDKRMNTIGRLSCIMSLHHQTQIKKIASQLKEEVSAKHGNLMDVVAKHAPTKRAKEAGSVNLFLQRVKRVKEEKLEDVKEEKVEDSNSATAGEQGQDAGMDGAVSD
eukprot:g11832.t1